mgnify:CR=1 FL=1
MAQRRATVRRGKGAKAAKKPSRARLNPRRQLAYVLVVLAALAVGYLGAMLIGGGPEEEAGRQTQAPAASGAWYKSQPPPPAMVRDDLPPILPEPNGASSPEHGRAYEEALPVDVYVSQHPASVPDTAHDTNGQAAWRQFALAAPETGGRPMIAVVIDDMGLDRKRSARIVALEGPLTLSFLTYAKDLREQGRSARAAGHELMLHVGMEPSSKAVDPGPNVLLTSDSPEEIDRRLVWGLGRLSGFVGINNHMGSKFTEDRRGMRVVMAELRKRGLLFLDSRTTAHSVGAEMAREFGVPAVERNVFLDNENKVEAVQARLAELERIAKHTGSAIAIGHPRDATIAALKAWIPSLEAKGLVLVPLTAIVRAAGKPKAG